MKNIATGLATLAFGAACITSALAVQYDGKLPLYPRGHASPGTESIPADALAHGVPYQQTTSDAVHLVDLWYKTYAGSGCSRNAAKGAVQYKCPGGSIVIQPHDGATIVSFVPPLGLGM